MGAFTRGLKNVYRNKARALLVIFILGLSIGILVSMTQTGEGVREQVSALESEVQTLIEIKAAGATGWGRGVEKPLNENIVEDIEGIPNVVKVEKYIFRRSSDPSQKYSIAAIIGTVPGNTLRLSGQGAMGEPKVISGRNFEASDNEKNVALMGKVYAEARGLTLGSTAVFNGTEVKVIGIFDSGFVFGNNQVFLPYKTNQRIYNEEGIVTHVFVTVGSVRNVEQVEGDIRTALGDTADVISGQDRARYTAETLAKMQSSSKAGAMLAAIVTALIILFTMILVTRERTKEIGVLKAIGASNGDIAKQFVVESLALSSIGALTGLIIFSIIGPQLASVLLDLRSIDLTPYYELSLPLVIKAMGIAFLFGMIGSLYSVARTVRMKPAEAVRHE